MANDLTADPLVVDTSATNIPCERIAGVAFDASGTGTFSIVDHATSKLILSGDQTMWYGINVTLPRPSGNEPAIDVSVSSGVVYIYLGSGPR